MRKIAVILAFSAAASTSALAADHRGFSLTSRTAHFSFYTRGAGVEAAKSERFLISLEAMLGQELDGRVDYYRYERVEDVGAATGAYVQGITYAAAREIHSAHGYHAHEIVHLVAGQIGDPGAFFQEGLAVALGNRGRWNGADVDTLARKALTEVAVADLVDRFDRVDGQKAYPAAGSFVRALIRRHGVRKIADFFRACPRAALRDAAFERTFGVSLPRATREWERSLR